MKLNKDYFNKKFLRGCFLVLALYTLAVFLIQGNIAPAYEECLEPFGCNNPFYGATGKVCEYNKGLCDQPSLDYQETLGTKPNALARSYNLVSMIGFLIMGVGNHILYKRKNGTNKNKGKK